MAEAVFWPASPKAPGQVRGLLRRQVGPATAAGAPAAAGAAGGVRWLLRAEGLALLAAALAAYAQFGEGWGLFALLVLWPDLAFVGYLFGPRAGAMAYNASHATLGPLALVAAGALAGPPLLLSVGLAWAAHVGLDRALGFGLKYASGFGDTHLGRIGRPDPW